MDFGSRGKGKVNIFVLNLHNKLQIMLINKTFLWKRKSTGFWQNHGIHGISRKSRFAWFPCFYDYLLSLSWHCPLHAASYITYAAASTGCLLIEHDIIG